MKSDLSKAITILRIRLGVDQREFAGLLGMNQQQIISCWETGKIKPSRKSVKKILNVAKKVGMEDEILKGVTKDFLS